VGSLERTRRQEWGDPVADRRSDYSAIDRGSVSVANGVMYAGSNSGKMYALDAKTGRILWGFASGGTVLDAPSIDQNALYWGSGYRILDGTGINKVYAFALPD